MKDRYDEAKTVNEYTSAIQYNNIIVFSKK
jgi:hypothetical protein